MVHSILKKFADNTSSDSFSHRQRKKRFAFFESKLSKLPRPLKILDIGGTVAFWQAMGFNDPTVSITLLNLSLPRQLDPGFEAIVGDATDLSFLPNKSYDLVFSNSVIEHLFSYENQAKMAAEVQRVGTYHYIQTPNYWFPIEPHWVFPGFQFLPQEVKYWLTQHCRLGHIPKANTREAAIQQVNEIQLLTKSQLIKLFPSSFIYTEAFWGFEKSFTAHNFQ